MLFFNRKYLAKCGHKTKLKDDVKAFGESIKTKIKLEKGKQIEYCHRCLEKMAIRCAWCGHIIFIGDPITLYSCKKGIKLPDYAVCINEELNQYVGCLHWNCAETGADRAGFWMSPGEVFRVKTPFEILMENPNKGAIMIDNVFDIEESLKS